MRIRSIIILIVGALAGCATSGTETLPTYTLADGTRMQDVITVAADKSGTAPVVTHSKTFKFGERGPELVAQASGSAPGMTAVVAGAAVSGAVGGVTAGVLSHTLRDRSSRNASTSYENMSCSQMPEPIRMTIQRCICEISSFNPGCENASNPQPDGNLFPTQ